MIKFKNRFYLFKSSLLQVAGVLLLIILAVFMLWFNNANSNQAIGATAARVRFNGEYRIGDGQWQTIEEGKHIPATKGDVTLRGNFHLFSPGGQIQPHFIYNTLGTIERMCLKDPGKASDLVRNFSLYLRGNFSELDSVTPIRFAEELKHVEYYVNIEKVRFPDMNIEYDVETTEFVLPALSVQPLVENAIKHGLMRLETDGTVVIRSYETPTHFCVEVKDDGVGFDTSLHIDEKKHVGLGNIRGGLKGMVNGDLILESKLNIGTKAVIMIPKEVIV